MRRPRAREVVVTLGNEKETKLDLPTLPCTLAAMRTCMHINTQRIDALPAPAGFLSWSLQGAILSDYRVGASPWIPGIVGQSGF